MSKRITSWQTVLLGPVLYNWPGGGWAWWVLSVGGDVLLIRNTGEVLMNRGPCVGRKDGADA